MVKTVGFFIGFRGSGMSRKLDGCKKGRLGNLGVQAFQGLG